MVSFIASFICGFISFHGMFHACEWFHFENDALFLQRISHASIACMNALHALFVVFALLLFYGCKLGDAFRLELCILFFSTVGIIPPAKGWGVGQGWGKWPAPKAPEAKKVGIFWVARC